MHQRLILLLALLCLALPLAAADPADLTLDVAGRVASRLAFSPDSRMLATISHNPDRAGLPGMGQVQLWDLGTGQARIFAAAAGAVNLAFSPDGALLATSAAGGTVTLWDSATLRPVHSFEAHEGPALLAFTPDGDYLITGDSELVYAWSLNDFDRRSQLPDMSGGALTSLAVSDDGARLALGYDFSGIAGFVMLLNLPGGSFAGPPLELPGDSPAVLFFLSDPALLAAGARSLGIWDLTTGALVHLFEMDGPLSAAVFNADYTLTATGGSRTLMLWDAAGAELLVTVDAHDGLIHDLAFSPDGVWLASAGDDGVVRLWLMEKLLER